MADRTRNIIVGLTTLAALVGLAFMLTLFGYMPRWTQDGYPLQITFPDASGLTEGSRVRLAGIDIGRVENIQLMDPASLGVRVTAMIEKDVDIPREARAVIHRPLLGGSAVLALEVAHLSEQGLTNLPRDGTAMISGEQATMLGDISGQLEGLMEGPMEQFQVISDHFSRLSEQWEIVGANLNRLIEPRDLTAVDNGSEVGNLTTVLARTDQRLAELRHVLEGIERYTGDVQLHEDVRATAANVRELSASAQQQMDQLTRRFMAAADDLSAAIANANGALEQARTGDGTVGRLLNDPALFNNLNDAAQRITSALDEVVLLVQKWRQEGLPIQF